MKPGDTCRVEIPGIQPNMDIVVFDKYLRAVDICRPAANQFKKPDSCILGQFCVCACYNFAASPSKRFSCIKNSWVFQPPSAYVGFFRGVDLSPRYCLHSGSLGGTYNAMSYPIEIKMQDTRNSRNNLTVILNIEVDHKNVFAADASKYPIC